MRTPRLPAMHRGFTLIEMMVVVLIVAIMLGVSALAMRSDALKLLKSESHQLIRQIELARQDGAMRQRRVVLKVDRLGWDFFQRGPAGLKLITEPSLRGKKWSKPLSSVSSNLHETSAGKTSIDLDNEPIGGPIDLLLVLAPYTLEISRNQRGQLVASQLQ